MKTRDTEHKTVYTKNGYTVVRSEAKRYDFDTDKTYGKTLVFYDVVLGEDIVDSFKTLKAAKAYIAEQETEAEALEENAHQNAQNAPESKSNEERGESPMKIKNIENITKSEQKKAIRYFEKKHPGSAVIASGWATNRRSESDIETGFQTVSVELWNEEERESYTVYLAVCLWDRRRSFAMEDAENWYREPTEEATTHTINNNEEENAMTTTNTLQNTTDFEIEIQRSNITPAQFLAYVRSRVDAKGGHWYRSDLDLRWFKNEDSRWNCEYSFGLPGERGASSEVSKDMAYDKQTYVLNFDGSVYNEIVEFDFDDEKTGHGYYYLVNKSAVPGCEESNKRYLIEQAKRYNEREIKRVERKIAEKKEHLEREREWLSKFWIEMEERDIRTMEMEIENRLDDIAECDEILGTAEAEEAAEEEEQGEEIAEAAEITEEELDDAIAEEVEKEITAEQKVDEILEKVEQTKTRSAWDRGVKEYALELLDDLGYGARHGYIEADELENRRLLEKAMLNGASDWKQYSEGGCALCYDGKIAERLCAPWELRKTDNGRKGPNPRESWIDVQSRALYQAAQMILRVAF